MQKTSLGTGDNLIINLSKACNDQIGPGYIARADEVCDARSCSEEDMYRFKCKFEPLNTTNAYSVDLSDETLESFSNMNENISLWKIGLIVIVIATVFYFFSHVLQKANL